MDTLPSPTQVDALILAAGEGNRLGLGPKAMLMLNGHPLVEYVACLARPFVGRVAVATLPSLVATCQELLPWATIFTGGSSRQETLKILLSRTTAPYVLVMEAARPFTSKEEVEKVLRSGVQGGAAALFVPSHVPNALLSGGTTSSSIPSNQLLICQTPQVYRREILLAAYTLAHQHGWHTQSTIELLHAAKQAINVVIGEETNQKITTPLDWQIAQTVLAPLLPILPS